MKTSIRSGLLSGIIFGIIVILVDLIGLFLILSELLSNFFANIPIAILQFDTTQCLAIMLILLGLWCGARGARPTKPDTWNSAIVGGLSAGVSAGVLVGMFAFLIGTINSQGIDMREYLAQMSPEAIDFFLFGNSSIVGALIHFALFTISGLVGGILAKALGRGRISNFYHSIRESLGSWWQSTTLANRISKFSYTQYVVYSVLLLLAIFIPLNLNQYWNFTLGTVGIYVLMGLGINIVVGLAGLLDLGYVAFFAVGAYTVGLLTSPQQLANFQLNFWVAGLIGIIIAALTGVILGFPVLRLRGDYLAIVTLGFGEIIRILVRSDLLSDFTGGPQGIRDIAGPSIFGISLNSDRAFMYMILLAILLAIFVTIRFQESRVGRSWVAIREDETVAQAMGINTYISKLLAFAVGAAFAGLGGVIFASRAQYIGPEDANLLVSINVLAVVIVGGMGSIPGVFLGAFVLKGLPEILRQLQDYRILIFGALLVVMMIVRPEGLWPAKQRRLELHSPDDQNNPEPEGELNSQASTPSQESAG